MLEGNPFAETFRAVELLDEDAVLETCRALLFDDDDAAVERGRLSRYRERLRALPGPAEAFRSLL